MGKHAADGQRETRLSDRPRPHGRHRPGDRRVRQGESRRGPEGAAEDGAGGRRRGQRQGKRMFFLKFFIFLCGNPSRFDSFHSLNLDIFILRKQTRKKLSNSPTDQDRPAEIQGRDGTPRPDRVADPLVQRHGLLEGEGCQVEDRVQDWRRRQEGPRPGEDWRGAPGFERGEEGVKCAMNAFDTFLRT